jgi:predicted TPR repeat methyltransferase
MKSLITPLGVILGLGYGTALHISSPFRSSLKGNVFQMIATSENVSPIELQSRAMFSIQEPPISANIMQLSNGPIPRGYLPGILKISCTQSQVIDTFNYGIIETAIGFYLDGGGRISQLFVITPIEDSNRLHSYLSKMGFQEMKDVSIIQNDETLEMFETFNVIQQYKIYQTMQTELQKYCEGRLSRNEGAAETLHDIIGRLLHDSGNPKEAVNSYTSGLLVNPKSASIFRNLGSAYHAAGDVQMAFASYQQALSLDAADLLVYLKLAYLYEDLAAKDWQEAAEYAQKCYQFYLDKVDAEDTSVLTRLGNLLMKEHMYEEASEVYNKALQLNNKLYNVWFNLAHSQLKRGDYSSAIDSLRTTLEIQPSISSARHMLKALSEEDSDYVIELEDEYVKDLFNSYGNVYDDQVKKLRYAAPRVIRQEMAKIYKAKYEKDMSVTIQGDRDFNVGGEQIGGKGCSTYTKFMNASLDILDLGCGTGLAGSWLKDYAATMVGVDISEQMILAAGKKMLYQELQVKSIADYMETCKKTFDLVVAADVLAYIGDLSETLPQVSDNLSVQI